MLELSSQLIHDDDDESSNASERTNSCRTNKINCSRIDKLVDREREREREELISARCFRSQLFVSAFVVHHYSNSNNNDYSTAAAAAAAL